MSRFLSTLLNLCLILGLGSVVLLGETLESSPQVALHQPLGARDLERARQLLQADDPGHLTSGADASLALSETDANLAFNYLFKKRFGASARVDLEPRSLQGEITVPLPPNAIDSYLNITLEVQESRGQPRLTGLRLGRLDLPLELDYRMLGDLLSRLFTGEELPLIRAGFRRVHFHEDRMLLVYRWTPELIAGAGDLVLGADGHRIVGIYYRELANALGARPDTLIKLLKPVFRLAGERSIDSDPVVENRAALIALGLYAIDRDAVHLLPEVRTADFPDLPPVTLRQREDLARHYLVSAAISASSDGDLSDIIGVYKEWRDSRSGSGFSFADLAADRAGTRLGQLATATPDVALLIQEIFSEGVSDSDLLPPVTDLPEHISEDAFNQSYGGIGSRRYENMRATIDRQLDALPLYTLH